MPTGDVELHAHLAIGCDATVAQLAETEVLKALYVAVWLWEPVRIQCTERIWKPKWLWESVRVRAGSPAGLWPG